jgi:RNA polymerase sigma-B factor
MARPERRVAPARSGNVDPGGDVGSDIDSDIDADADADADSDLDTGIDADAEHATSRAQARAATLRLLCEMAALPADAPERAAIREAVIADHMPYARYLANRYGAHGDQGEDLLQVAYLGLVKAVDNFDPAFGTAFLTYATPMIVGEIKRYYRDATWAVHVPRRMQELASGLRAATEQLTHDLGRSPSVDELAARLRATPEEVVDAIDAAGAYTTASLDAPVETDGPNSEGSALGELLGDDDPGIAEVVDRETLKPLIAALPARDKRILLMRYFRGMTQAQIGEELGVSQMQVSRLLSRILRQLRAGTQR